MKLYIDKIFLLQILSRLHKYIVQLPNHNNNVFEEKKEKRKTNIT